MIRIAAILLILSTAVGGAQTLITPEQFIERAVGRTLTFANMHDGRIVGIEEFLSRQQTVWARRDGSCTYGHVTLTRDQVCFRYEDQEHVSHCWYPHDQGGTLVMQSPLGPTQQVTRITDLPVVCHDPPLS
ncbi:hypothetical protein A8B82_07520 [Sulfitobacter sp. EhC04]|uniref:hypothetical protein n=1 Tax=Sulfitobacter sp. EhC04 TaxID=1849168 RepID=UPI0007F46FF1|nr:hypothetical protein [Sulfitobacter sp. EhC04]OAN79874.1 hypothetical protein A8B82_07520 [Sulfitobacter sp. EhC04]